MKYIFKGILILLFITSCKSASCKKHQHIEIIDKFVEATCQNEGLTEGSHCKICNEVIKEPEVIKRNDHQYANWEVKQIPTVDNLGIIYRRCINCNVEESKEITYDEIIKLLQQTSEKLIITSKTKTDLNLPLQIENIAIFWKSSNVNILSALGKIIKRTIIDKEVCLYATFSLYGVTYEKQYHITILGYDELEKIKLASQKVNFPKVVTGNLNFKQSLQYKVKATYTSSNEKIITNDGILIPQKEDSLITITVLFNLGESSMEKQYELLVKKYDPEEKLHQLTFDAKKFDLTNQDSFAINNDQLVLKENILEATYYSSEYSTLPFRSLVGSFSAITNAFATCELKVSLKVNEKWSDYITYNPWGLGLQNKSVNNENDLIKLSIDEVLVKNNQYANGIKYAITFKKSHLSDLTPRLSLVSFALEIDDYSFYIDQKSLPNKVEYDVPKLNQNIVPEIGNSICSATSTTMILKYYGYNFTNFDFEFEHRYIASVVKDYGNNIYGNWVYNVLTLGGYGLKAYVARMYSLEELMYTLANVGPVALSVSGTMTSNIDSYHTNGHLIVCTGYEYIDDELYFICNDPNLKEVKCYYHYDIIDKNWKDIAYVATK